MAKPKITEELVERAVGLKADGLSNADIIAALGISETTFYRWLQKPTDDLHRALKEGLKKAEAAYKRELLDSIKSTATREKNPQWTAAAWLLERKYPDEFAQTTRAKDEAREDVPQIVLGVSVKAAKSDGGDD